MSSSDNSKPVLLLGEPGTRKMIIGNRMAFLLVASIMLSCFVMSIVYMASGHFWFGLPLLVFGLAYSYLSTGVLLQILAVVKILQNVSDPNHLANELYIRKLNKLLQALPVKQEPYRMMMHYYISYTQQYQGKHGDAIEELSKIDTKLVSKDKQLIYPYYAIQLSNLSISLRYRGRLDEALATVNKSIAICNDRKENDRHAIVYALTAKAETLIELEEYDQALKCTQDSLKAISDVKKPPSWMMPISLQHYKFTNVANLASTFLLMKDTDKVEVHIMQLESIYNKNNNVVTEAHFRSITRLADCLKSIDRVDLAERMLRLVYKKAAGTPFHPDIAPMLDLYEEILTLEGRKDDVANMRSWLLPLT